MNKILLHFQTDINLKQTFLIKHETAQASRFRQVFLPNQTL